MIGMAVAAERIERDDDLRLISADDLDQLPRHPIGIGIDEGARILIVG